MLGGEGAVADAGGLPVVAFERAHVFFVGFVVTFEPDDFVAFEGEDVGGNSVEEPAIVADDNGASAKVDEAFFEGAEGANVEVVGRFVEEEEVAAAAEEFCEVNAVAFAAGEKADFLLLFAAFKVEAGAVGAAIHFSVANR